jgi:arsenate reductase
MSWKADADEIKKNRPLHILFLCVANSARSQMGEGIARHLAPAQVQISSAGSTPTKVNPLAIVALSEIGIDITTNYSKSVESINPTGIDVVITLCAEEVCPIFLGKAKRYHWGLPDPSSSLDSFRKVRDELFNRLSYLFDQELEN